MLATTEWKTFWPILLMYLSLQLTDYGTGCTVEAVIANSKPCQNTNGRQHDDLSSLPLLSRDHLTLSPMDVPHPALHGSHSTDDRLRCNWMPSSQLSNGHCALHTCHQWNNNHHWHNMLMASLTLPQLQTQQPLKPHIREQHTASFFVRVKFF